MGKIGVGGFVVADAIVPFGSEIDGGHFGDLDGEGVVRVKFDIRKSMDGLSGWAGRERPSDGPLGSGCVGRIGGIVES